MEDVPGSPPRARRALRILVVTNLYPTAAHPAFGTFVGSRVASLRRTGNHVSVAAITDDHVHERIAPKYARLALRSVASAVTARLRRRPYDVVEAHIAFPTGLAAWPAARLSGARLVLFCHGSDVTTLPWRSPLRTALARRLFAGADLVIANSRFTARIAEERLGPLRRPAVVISPGIAIPPADGVASRPARPADHVVFVGRLVPGKGAEVLFAAMARLSQAGVRARLTIVGDGPLRPTLETQAVRFDGAVTFTGALAPAQVQAVLDEATIVAIPSTAEEGLSLVALEAMARGALVVATDAGGLAETVRHGENGIVVARGDDVALANALANLLRISGTPDGEHLRAAGRTTASAHEVDGAVAESVRRYEGLRE